MKGRPVGDGDDTVHDLVDDHLGASMKGRPVGDGDQVLPHPPQVPYSAPR